MVVVPDTGLSLPSKTDGIPRESGRILLVEDDPDDQRFLRRALEKSGRDVLLDLASDGQAAMNYLSAARLHADQARGRTVHLVLSDVQMPFRSGWDVLKWIRRQQEFSSLPVLLWTSLATPEGAKRAKILGAQRYLSKPRDLAGYDAIATLIVSLLGD